MFLWLGANTMLEYSIDEASVLLNKNEKAAIEQIELLVKIHSKRVKKTESYTRNECISGIKYWLCERSGHNI